MSSLKTMEGHHAHVLAKLDLRSRTGLLRYPLAHGLLTSEQSAP